MRPRIRRVKIAKIIRCLDEIILDETEQTYGLAVLRKCRNQLQRLLVKSTRKRKAFDSIAFFVAIMKLVEVLHSFINRSNSK